MLRKLIGKKMKEDGLSMRTAAKEIGVSHTTVNRVLTGSPLDIPTLLAICDWLDVQPATALNSLASSSDDLVTNLALAIETMPE